MKINIKKGQKGITVLYPEVSVKSEPWADSYFKNNKHVAGMAIGGGLNGIEGPRRVIVNPYNEYMKNSIQKAGLIKNERLRHYMEETNFKLPNLNSNQIDFYKNTPYENDTINIGRTEAARYLTGDKSHHLNKNQIRFTEDYVKNNPVIKKFGDGGKSILDSNKIYNRIPAREWGPDGKDLIKRRFAPIYLFKYYFFGNDNNANNLVEKANSIIKTSNSEEAKNDALSYLAHEDAKDKYLNKPQRTGLVIKSNYKPSTSKNKNIDYFKFKFMDGDYFKNNKVLDDLLEFNLYDNIKEQHYVDPTLNTFKASLGLDKNKGPYLSIYDIWDYNKKIEGGGKDNISKIIGGKPFEIYDRIYLDDYYGINTKPKKGDYYGGYLPEVVIKADDENKY